MIPVLFSERTRVRNLKEENLSKAIFEKGGLKDFIVACLSIKPNSENYKRLEALPLMVQENALSFTLEQIKKAFWLYSNSKLNIEPRSNYFDVVIFAKVINAYRDYLPAKKLQALPPKKDNNSLLNLQQCWKDWEEKGEVVAGYYDVWDELKQYGLVDYPPKEKEKAQEMALRRLRREYGKEAKPTKKWLLAIYKRICLEQIFKQWREDGYTIVSKIEGVQKG